MAVLDARRAFLLFHVILGLGLLIAAFKTLIDAVGELHGDHIHLAGEQQMDFLVYAAGLWLVMARGPGRNRASAPA